MRPFSMADAALAASSESGLRGFTRRVTGAVRLQPGVWDEIAADPGALGQAAVVALAAAAAGALAAAGTGPAGAALETGVATLAAWLAVAGLVWSAANGLRHRLALGTALRLVGFAMAPLAGIALAAVPMLPVQAVVRLLCEALFFAALVVGCRQALRVETTRAALVCATAGLGLLFLTLLAMAVQLSVA